MVEVHRHDLGDPNAAYSMLLSHILGPHGIEWHSNIIVTTKNSSVQACLDTFRELSRKQLQQMKDAIIAEFKQIKDPDKELLEMDSKRMESLTDDCLCLAVASHVLDPEHYPLIPYTVGSGFFLVESPIKKRPEEVRVVSPVP